MHEQVIYSRAILLIIYVNILLILFSFKVKRKRTVIGRILDILFATVQFSSCPSNTNFTYSFCIAILYISQLFENISKDLGRFCLDFLKPI